MRVYACSWRSDLEIESWFYMEVNTLNKTLSIIYADTSISDWSIAIEVFGVTDNEEDAKRISDSVKEQGYYPQVEVVTLNEECREYLGGYCE